MIELLQYDFMKNAIIAAMLASLICGTLGPVSVIKRSIMTAGGIAHGAYAGIGIAWYLSMPPRIGAYIAAIVLSIVAIIMKKKAPGRSDSVMGIIWAVGMAVGIVFSDLTPGYGSELMSYLFGSIMAVSRSDILIMAGLSFFIVIPLIFFYRKVELFLFDEIFALTRGVKTEAINCYLTVVTAISVVAVIRVVGLIMVIALFTIPSLVSERLSSSLKGMICKSVVLSFLFSIIGLIVSVKYDITAGASIILVSSVFYILSLKIKSS